MKKFLKELIPYVVIIAVVILIRTFIVTPVRVDGKSMNPTLDNSQILLLKKFDKKYERFDIIVFEYNNDKLVKRIVGLPGDKIKYKDNKLYINNKYIKEDFKHKDTADFTYEEEIPEDMYFVLGDNRTNSLDSRYIGLIPEKSISGTVDTSLIPVKKVK